MKLAVFKEKTDLALWVLLGALIFSGVCFFWGSVLSFFPVPWPDDSAFFLPGIQWVSSSPRYLMHAQAPFVPTYDQANFNTMPALPLLFGLAHRLGVHTSHALRFLGMLVFGGWAFALAAFARRRGVGWGLTFLLTLCALFSPSIRWGAMVVRPEIWQGLIWVLLVLELDSGRSRLWRVSGFLACAAYIHFEAFLWIGPVALGLYPASNHETPWAAQWLKSLWGVFLRTLLFLLPWLIYVALNWDIFWIQLNTQFGRLHAYHPYITSLHSFFHSLFMELGSPVGFPKFFNLAKIMTWIMIVFGVFVGLRRIWREPKERAIGLAVVSALFGTFYLWMTKPETWFTAMIHLSLWVLFVFALSGISQPFRKIWAFGLGLLLVLHVGVAVHQWREARDQYSWESYEAWVNCIDATIGARTKIWQPHWPDVLVQLAGKDPNRDYTRAVDFQNVDALIEKHAHSSEVIIHSLFLPLDHPLTRGDFRGPPRGEDLHFVTDYPWMPFKQYSAASPTMKGWSLQICQRGPFWAAVSLKGAR
ncbi:hypothetical protein WDW86_01290 [Bdellovibrionota bacterium FG-2]